MINWIALDLVDWKLGFRGSRMLLNKGLRSCSVVARGFTLSVVLSLLCRRYWFQVSLLPFLPPVSKVNESIHPSCSVWGWECNWKGGAFQGNKGRSFSWRVQKGLPSVIWAILVLRSSFCLVSPLVPFAFSYRGYATFPLMNGCI